MDQLLAYAGIPAVLLIIGIAQTLKNAGLNPKYIPIVDVVLGLIAGIMLNTDDIVAGVFTGIAVGLSACGLYSAAKNTKEGIQ